MRRKLRYLVIFIVIAFLLWLAAPFVTGVIFKENYLALLRANQNEKVQVLEYSNGWFSSDAKIYIRFKAGEGNVGGINVPSGFTLVQHITHGPYLQNPSTGEKEFLKAAIETQVHLDANTENKLLGSRAEQGVMVIDTLVSFGNNYFSQIMTPVFNFKLSNGAQISWLGLNGSVSADVSGKYVTHLVTELKNGMFTLQNNASSLVIAESTIENNINCGENKVCTGTQKLYIPKITGNTQGGENIELTELVFNFDSKEQNKKYSNSYGITLRNLVFPDNSVGPINFKLSCNNINEPELLNFVAKLRAEQKNILKAESPQLFLAGEFNEGLAPLIMPDTSMTGFLNVSTTFGNLVANAKLFWPPSTPLPADKNEMLEKINLQMNIRAAVPLVNQIVTQIDENLATTATPVVVKAPKIDFEPALPTVAEFKDELNMMLEHKQILPEIIKAVMTMQESQSSPDDVNSYLDGLTRDKKITASNAYAVKMAYSILFRSEQRAVLIAIFNDPATTMKDLDSKLEMLVNVKIITATTAKELQELQDQSLAPEIYAVALHNFVANHLIPQDLESQLKAQYASINKDLSLNPDMGLNAPTAPADENAVPKPIGKMQNELNTLIKEGYLTQNKNDYVAAIVYENGQLKINGVIFK